MKKLLTSIISLSLIICMALAFSACGKETITIDSDEPPIKIGWSDWVGWMPWEIVEKENLLAENGANAELVYFDSYTDSIAALEQGTISALSVTINDALALKGTLDDLQIVLINDVSDGGDGILVKKELNLSSVKDLKGKKISLEKNSVSHFLLLRALEENGLTEEDVEINDVSADLAGTAFLGSAFLDEEYTQVVVTWNPHLSKAKNEGKGTVLFDSSQIYGEITDVLVAKKSLTEARTEDFQAVINSWYGAMEMIDSPKTRDAAISIMAKKSDVSNEEFENLLIDTEVFTKVRKAVEFLGTNGKGKLYTFTQRVQDFLLKQGILEEAMDLKNFINPTFVIEYYNSQ